MQGSEYSNIDCKMRLSALSPSVMGDGGLEYSLEFHDSESARIGTRSRVVQIHVIIAIEVLKKAYKAVNIQRACGPSYTPWAQLLCESEG